ncbi:MAG: hypothetical protein ACRDZX_16315 [Acidimicrobiales bacterium]
MGIVGWVVLGVVVAGIIVAILGWDRYRGNSKRTSDSSASQPTGEVFNDPASGQRMRVWYNSTTGQREYRPE